MDSTQNQQFNSCCTHSKVNLQQQLSSPSSKQLKMKHFSPLCLFLVTLAVANASVLPVKRNHLPAVNQQGDVVWLDEMSHSVPDKCDFSCTDQDLSVCAHNGQCLQLFTSRCTMAAYNCRNPQKRFNIVENYKCTQGYVPLCSPEERKELGITM